MVSRARYARKLAERDTINIAELHKRKTMAWVMAVVLVASPLGVLLDSCGGFHHGGVFSFNFVTCVVLSGTALVVHGLRWLYLRHIFNGVVIAGEDREFV